jgi:uncharacterized protein (TIGR03083 family)
MDAGEIYAETRGRIVQLVAGRPEGDLDRMVPATPAWRVRDVVAHLTGGCDDILAGRLDGVTTEPWTAAQVDKRKGTPLDAVLAEWAELSPRIEDQLRQFGEVMGALVADIATHEQDLRGALQQPGARDSAGMDFGLQLLVSWLDGRLEEHGLGLRVRAANQEWEVGKGAPGATVTAPDAYELNRALLGRRSRAQVAAWEWDAEPSPYLDAFFTFPPRDTDLVE